MMKISTDEQAAIAQTLRFGRRFGYGNLISHLRTAWAESLMRDHGMDEETAREAAHGGNHMPFKMQHDLVLRGEWDETGERYKQSPEDTP